MEPDQNLQKINEVKITMLKQSIMKSKQENWPLLKDRIQVMCP